MYHIIKSDEPEPISQGGTYQGDTHHPKEKGLVHETNYGWERS